MKMAVDDAEKQRMAELAEVARHVIHDNDLDHRAEARGEESTSAFNSLLVELQDERSKLEVMAFTDMLTGVSNRRMFIEQADAALRAAKRRGSVMALAYVDLDDFKVVNDTYGHDAGDTLLKAIAERLQQAVREVDDVARLGADEFTLILQDVGSKTYVDRLVSRIYSAVLEPVDLGDENYWDPSCSIGVVLSDGIEELKHLMARAEKTMFQVKHSGKNQYMVKDLFDDE